MSGPLTGIRIIELPAVGPVPFVGMLLADLGAEVIRIDRLPGGPARLGDNLPAGPLGRGHRSIGLDLRQPGAAAVVLRLVARADALIEGFRPGVAERLGIGPAEAQARNPALVYGRMTGWGQTGPLAARAGHDITYLAISGLLHGIGPAAMPVPPVNYVADFGGGAMFLATGLLAGLLQARVSGQGQVIDAAMTEGAAYLSSPTRTFLADGAWVDHRGANLLDGGAPNYRCYECSDRRFIAVGALEPQFWANLVAALGHEVDSVPSPYDPVEWPECAGWLASIFLTRTRDDWAALLEPLDACVAPVLTLEEAPLHPHLQARAAFTAVGDAVLAAPTPRFSLTPGAIGALTPPGRDTLEVLDEIGVDQQELATLRQAGAIS